MVLLKLFVNIHTFTNVTKRFLKNNFKFVTFIKYVFFLNFIYKQLKITKSIFVCYDVRNNININL